MTVLTTRELTLKESVLKTACKAANRDKFLEKEIDEWQSFQEEVPIAA